MSYGGPLKYKTVQMVKIGPFIDNADGKTPETGLTITAARLRLTKYNSKTMAAKNHAKAAYHKAQGWYWASLDATDTNTFGELVIAVVRMGLCRLRGRTL